MKLSVVIIAFNEADNIGACIDSVNEIADEIIVLDSFSTEKRRVYAGIEAFFLSSMPLTDIFSKKTERKVWQLMNGSLAWMPMKGRIGSWLKTFYNSKGRVLRQTLPASG